MSLKYERKAVIPAGAHTGEIIAARETTKTFDERKGAEPVVEITIQPAWKAPDNAAVLPVSVIFTPELNGLSALSKYLERMDMEPEEGANWDPAVLNGKKVAFTAEKQPNGFVRVLKDTLRGA